MRLISGTLCSTLIPWLPVLSNIEPPALRGCHWQAGGENRQTWQLANPAWYLNPPLLLLTSRKPLWLVLQPVDIKSRWRHNRETAQVVNSHLVCDPTIRQLRFLAEQGHCVACRRKWRLPDTDLCPCGETQTMFHIVESCPLTELNGGLSWLHLVHSADEDAVSWLTSYGSWHAYDYQKKEVKWSAEEG